VSTLLPAVTGDRVSAAAFPTAYGVVFTGWGCAGLLASLAGGQLLWLTERQPALLNLAVSPLIGTAFALLLLPDRAPGQVRS
jgi:OFA family oxalate/formate antiporter-like MFS transporter